MSESVYMRQVVDALMPEGPILSPAPSGYLDRLLDGIADNQQAIMEAMESLANIRNPWKCPIELLPDLEREFGITSNPTLTISNRRKNLALVRYKRRRLGTVAKLQTALDRAGFGAGGYGLIVTPNASPAVDPGQFVDRAYWLSCHNPAVGDRPSYPQAGQICARSFDGSDSKSGEQCAGAYATVVSDPNRGSNACCGDETAFAGLRSGYYLVNGDSYMLSPSYPQAGQICARSFDGSDTKSGEGCAGAYRSYVQYANEYVTPSPELWPLIFFVGGFVTRTESGQIVDIAPVQVPSKRRTELHRIILRIKPMGIWAAMTVQYF